VKFEGAQQPMNVQLEATCTAGIVPTAGRVKVRSEGAVAVDA